MHDKKLANEWLFFVKRDLEEAQLLYNNDFYNDMIAFPIQQAIEKSYKALLVFNNQKIIKTHDLVMLLEKVKDFLDFEDYIEVSNKANDFYIPSRYPISSHYMPSKEEIKEMYDKAKELYEEVSKIIEKG